MLLISFWSVRAPHLSFAVDAGGDQNAVMQPYPAILRGQIAAAVVAIELLENTRHSDPGAGADFFCDIYISLASLRMVPVLFLSQDK